MYIHRYTPELALTLLPAPRLATAGLRRGLIHPLSPTAGLKLSVSKRRQTDRSSSSISKAEAAFCTFKNVTSDQQESFFSLAVRRHSSITQHFIVSKVLFGFSPDTHMLCKLFMSWCKQDHFNLQRK